jgi:hypothetical protein
MKVVFLAFANNREIPLPTLQEEEEAIYRILAPRALKQHFLLHREPFATLSRIAEYLTLYRDHIMVFHYSGHAERDRLILEEEAALAPGMARLLGACPHLKLVFLNGCSTKEQVEALLEAGVPLVMATSAPVEDHRATRFSIRFYQALENGMAVEEAFELASGEIAAMDHPSPIVFYRGIGLDREEERANLWGLFHAEGSDAPSTTLLPSREITALPPDYEPNRRLIEALWESLQHYSDQVGLLYLRECQGRSVSTARKRMAILNSLPAPVAEHLRKLMVPVEDENEGYDKVSPARLWQTVRTYQVTAEMLAFTLLAQLWESFFEQGGKLVLPPNRAQEMFDFLHLRPQENETYDYVGLIRTIRDTLDKNNVNYFMEELKDLRDMLYQEGPFQNSCFFMEVLRVKLNRQEPEPHEIGELCARAEESLANMLGKMGFLAKYTLAAIQDIDVIKYRHQQEAFFKHKVVYLRDLLGGLDTNFFELERFTDNRSVLFMDEETKNYLNLTPFVIDANAFEEDTDVSKIFFISHYEQATDTYVFKYVNKPDQEEDWIRISKNQKQFPIIKVQLDAFQELLKPAIA